MRDRLLKFLNHEQLTSKQFAGIIGVQPSSVSHILSGRNKPGFDFIEKTILKYPRLNVDWLITGRGDMLKDMPGEKNLFSEDYKSESGQKDEIKSRITDVNTTEKVEKSHEETVRTDMDKLVTDKESSSKSTTEKKKVELIIVMYNDKSFSEYFPSD